MIRLARPADDRVILALNVECEAQLSPLTLERLQQMMAIAYRVSVTDDASAMLVAFDERAPYWSPNFAWFYERYPRFVYVDRVAVTAAARGRGLARSLYEDLTAAAIADGHSVLCAEFYSDPPNVASEAFHAVMDFESVGDVFVAEYGKRVRMMVRTL